MNTSISTISNNNHKNNNNHKKTATTTTTATTTKKNNNSNNNDKLNNNTIHFRIKWNDYGSSSIYNISSKDVHGTTNEDAYN